MARNYAPNPPIGLRRPILGTTIVYRAEFAHESDGSVKTADIEMFPGRVGAELLPEDKDSANHDAIGVVAH